MPRIDRLGILCPTAKPGTQDKRKRQTTFNLWAAPDNGVLTLCNLQNLAKTFTGEMAKSLGELVAGHLNPTPEKFTMVVHPEMAKALLEATEWPSGVYDSELYDSELEDY